MELRRTGRVHYLVFPQWGNEQGPVHGFSARFSGVSSPPFRSLNLGFHTGDDPDNVVQNRRLFTEALGVDLGSVVSGQQVHGDSVAVVGDGERGRGAFSEDTALVATDGMVTDSPTVVLMGFFADCVPLFFYDPKRRVVGLGHAGWKGTLHAIGARVVEKMVTRFGSDTGDIQVGIGPAIGACCYEVGTDLADMFTEVFGGAQRSEAESANGAERSVADLALVRREANRCFLDLVAANRQALATAGIKERNIMTAGWCTSCRTDILYSHRRLGEPTGRMAALIGLR